MICIEKDEGKIVWQKDVAAKKIEKVRRSSSPANATAVAMTSTFIFYFASCGLFGFDHRGNQIWHHAMPCSKRFNGSGTSPILVGDHLILNRDDDRDNYILALDADSGDTIWKTTHRSGGGFGKATPVIWKKQVLIYRMNEVSAFELEDGNRNWFLLLNTTAASTPVVDGDKVYVSAWNNSGEVNQKVKLPKFEKIVRQADKNEDGELSYSEMLWGPKLLRRPELVGRKLGTDTPVKFGFSWLDFDRNGKINESEWQNASSVIDSIISDSQHGMTAIQFAGTAGNVMPKVI